MTIKQNAKKIFYKTVYPVARLYWFIFRPKTRGAKCLVEKDGKFLLVKLSYAHRRWTVPGGGVGRKESFIEAAKREIKEETGVEVFQPVLIGRYEVVVEYKKDTVEVFWGASSSFELKTDPVEIKEAKWFSRNELPEDRMPRVDRIFELYDEYKSRKN